MSLGIGLVVTSLIEHAERHPSQALVIVIMIMAGGVLTVFGVAYLTESMRQVRAAEEATMARVVVRYCPF